MGGLIVTQRTGNVQTASPSRSPSSNGNKIAAAEFSRLVRTFSEEGGYFFSDNFTSNESAYVYVLDPLRRMAGTGGAYIGVGPEQNFTYIAKLRPRIAFIVDIRRQAVLQHLMYKAIFELARNRAEFLSVLFSKPLTGPDAPGRDTPIENILDYFSRSASSEEAYRANTASIERTIEQDFLFPLSSSDRHDLEYVYQAFYRANTKISFRFGGPGYMGYGFQFPTLVDLILATDANGNRGNFLVKEDDYEFVRELQRENRVIPVVGDFAGKKALASIAKYLRENGYTLTAFYTSNVEQFLFDGGSFDDFVQNVRQMPLDEHSTFIRAVRAGGRMHPAYIPGHRMTQLLQSIPTFLSDYDKGLYRTYWDMVTTHYVAPQGAVRPAN